MKKHIAVKHIANNYKNLFSCYADDLHYIMKYTNIDYYNAGIAGWNCDIYINYEKDIAIFTGYRNTRGKKIPVELIEKYSDIAKEILKNHDISYNEKEKKIAENKENFLNELLAL